MDVAGHDADFGATVVAGRDDARAVGADETNAGAVLNKGHGLHHVQGGDSFGDADHDALALDGVKGISRFHDGLSGKGRWHVDDRGVGIGFRDGIEHGIPNGEGLALKLHGLTALAGGAPAHDVGAVLDHLVSVEHALLARDALNEDLGVFLNPNRHQFPPPMSSTIFCAPSARSSAG